MNPPGPQPSDSLSSGAGRDDAKELAARLQQRLLVLMFMSGDVAAFEALFHAYHLRLLHFIRKIIRSPDLADDVAQETWIAIHKNRMQLRDPDLFRAWSFSVARNLAYQHLRKLYKEPIIENIVDHPAIAAEPPATGLEEEIDRLYYALDRLKPAHREVLALKYLEGLSYEEIAEVVGENLGTVRSRLFYAKRGLSAILRRLKNLDSPLPGNESGDRSVETEARRKPGLGYGMEHLNEGI